MIQISSSQSDSTIAEFTVQFSRCIDARGNVVSQTLPEWASDPQVLIPLYRNMLQTRTFDSKALNLQRSGRLGTFGSPLGQEAIGVGVASAMKDSDVLVPSYREFSAQLWRGVTMTELLLYWGGDERGSDFQGPREDFPVSVPIASHACHAAGVAYAFKLRRQPRVVTCFLGDGATSKGDFYESLNAAGVWNLPLIFVVSNNQWAISVPVKKQTAAATLAQKAIAAGIGSEQVDGNDVIAVRQAAAKAIEQARSGGGPYLIEALTYRMSDHTTADDASRYRDADEVAAQEANDPLSRLQAYLRAAGLWSDQDQEKLMQECSENVEAAVNEYLGLEPQAPEAMFDYLYHELPDSLQTQRDQVVHKGDGDD
jgi:pyruvate dehydrogenase E1 component alpha subunit